MKNKKFSAILLVMAMILSLVVPVQAAETETTLLTANTLNDSVKAIIEADLGKTVNNDADLTVPEYTLLDGETVDHSDFTSMASTYSSMIGDGTSYGGTADWFNGVTYIPCTWSKGAWPGARTTGLVLDFGVAHDIEALTFWSFEDDTDVAFSEDFWESKKTPYFYRGVRISVSNNGTDWERVYLDDNGYVATKDTTEYQIKPDGSIDKTIHRHYCPLTEAKTAQYVRVEFAAYCQYRLTELMVFGDKYVAPVAGEDDVYLLTNNAVLDEDAEAFAEQTGVEKYFTTDGTVTVVENNGAGASIEPPAVASTLFDGMYWRNGIWTRWGTNFDVTIDLDGTADLEKVVFWTCTNRGNFNTTEDEFWADVEANGVAGSTFVNHNGDLISKYEVQISEDGVAWETIETNEAPAFTKDNMSIEKADDGNVINTFFRFEVDLEEAKAARYIRLALNRGAYQVRVSEIAAFGKNYEKFEIVPETSKVVLTQNTFSVETLSRIAKLSGQKIYAYPTEGYVPTVTTTTNGFCERNSDIPAMFDGTISDQAWSVWGGAGQSLDMIIDLGGTQVVEEVVYWNNATGTDQSMKLVYSDNLWEEYKDTFDFASIAVSTSKNGKDWEEQVAPTAPATATADSTWFQGPNDNIDRVLHAHVVTLPEAVSARYVKVTVKEKDGDYQFRSGEVAVLGDATAKKMYDVVSGQTALSDEVLGYMGDALDGEVTMTGKYSPVKMVVTDPLGFAAATDSANLQNGDVTDRNVCISGWNNQTGYIDIDLGAVQEVSSVFLWNVASDTGKPNGITGTEADHTARKGESFRAVKVWTSEDGETYTEGAKIEIGGRTEDEVWFDSTMQRICHAYQYDLAETVNARYVRVEIDFGYHLNMGEAIVVGKRINEFTKNIVSGQTNVDEAGKSNLNAFYSDMGITLGKVDSTATIKYDDADVDNTGRDSSLSDSFITLWTGPTGGSEATSTKWDHSPVNMYVTFDQEVLVNGVDIWCTDEDPYRYTNSIDIYKSADGTEWELVGSANNTFAKATGGQYQNYISFTCEPVKTKYLRVDAIRGRHQNVIGELIVFGELPPAPPAATTPVFWTGDSEWEYGDQSAISAVTSTITGGEGILVLAAYNAVGALSNVWTATGKGDVSIDFDEDEMYDLVNEYDSFKAFAIKSFDDMYPLGTYSEVDLGK